MIADHRLESHGCSRRNVFDTDSDGLWDAVEAQLGTQARLQDTDLDYLTDSEEASIFGTSPIQYDSDADGLPDYYEADLTDTDGGGIPDLMEQVWLMDPLNPLVVCWDADNEGMSNVEEYLLGFDIRTDF